MIKFKLKSFYNRVPNHNKGRFTKSVLMNVRLIEEK